MIILGYCCICKTVKYDPDEARIWSKGELLQLFQSAEMIPKGIENTPSIFCGFQPHQKEPGVMTPTFVSIESMRFKELEKKRNRNLEFQDRQRISWCTGCRTIQLFTIKTVVETEEPS